MLSWCDRNNVRYLVGIAKNKRLNELSRSLQDLAQTLYQESGKKQRLFDSIEYAAGTWDRSRRVIAKAKYNWRGANPRYVVTNLAGEDQDLYNDVYCARGDMENRIKEQQLGLFAD